MALPFHAETPKRCQLAQLQQGRQLCISGIFILTLKNISDFLQNLMIFFIKLNISVRLKSRNYKRHFFPRNRHIAEIGYGKGVQEAPPAESASAALIRACLARSASISATRSCCSIRPPLRAARCIARASSSEGVTRPMISASGRF